MKSLNRHSLAATLALFALLGPILTVHASASVGQISSSAVASKGKSKAKKHSRHHPPTSQHAPVDLVPHINTFRGELVSICDTGWPTVCGAPSEMATVARCPEAYVAVSGGFEAFGSPQNLSVTMNSINGGDAWTVSMRANATRLSDDPHVSQFRAVVNCQILLPA